MPNVTVNGSVIIRLPAKPSDVVNATTQTTIPQEVAKPGMFDKVVPLLPWILGVGVLIFFGWLAYKLIKEKQKGFSKDYDKEFYRRTKDSLTADTPRVVSKTGFFVAFVTILCVFVVFIVQFFAYLMKLTENFSFLLTGIVGLVALGGSWAFTRFKYDNFVSHPVIVGADGEPFGKMVSLPRKSPDGYLNVAYFKRFKWLIFKDIKILSIPLNDKIEYYVLDKTKNERVKKTIELPKWTKDAPRYVITKTGDIRVNATDFYDSQYFTYPLYDETRNESNVFDFREAIFLREKSGADNLNLYDVANETRENAIVLSGGNPYVRLGKGVKRENE